jgi:hypothetical protein
MAVSLCYFAIILQNNTKTFSTHSYLNILDLPGAIFKISVVALSVVDNSESSPQALKRAGLAGFDQPIRGFPSQWELNYSVFP